MHCMKDVSEKCSQGSISFIIVFIKHIEELLEDLENRYAFFRSVKDDPETVDGDVVKNALILCRRNSKEMVFYQKQLSKWEQGEQGDQQSLLEIFSQKLSATKKLNAILLDLVMHILEQQIK